MELSSIILIKKDKMCHNSDKLPTLSMLFKDCKSIQCKKSTFAHKPSPDSLAKPLLKVRAQSKPKPVLPGNHDPVIHFTEESPQATKAVQASVFSHHKAVISDGICRWQTEDCRKPFFPAVLSKDDQAKIGFSDSINRNIKNLFSIEFYREAHYESKAREDMLGDTIASIQHKLKNNKPKLKLYQ